MQGGSATTMTILQDRYELIQVLAEGGENLVYLAKDKHTQEQVILKRTKNGILPEAREKWKQQVKLLQQLDLTTVATVYDSFIHVSEMVSYGYVVQQYIRGENLEQEYQRKRYNNQEVLLIVREILSILCELQELSPPILHRDIKPSNIVRHHTSQKMILLDFGLATEQQDKEFGHTIGVGTLGYQAPEQLLGHPTLGTDVYSVGVLALQLLTRREPKDLLWGYHLKWESAAQFLHEDWKQWLSKTLAPNEDRFPDAHTALEALLRPSFAQRNRTQPTEPTASNRTNSPPPPPPHIDQPTVHRQPPPVRSTNIQKDLMLNKQMRRQDEIDKNNQLLVASGCSFLFLGFFAIPFIYFFWQKKKRLESDSL